MAKERIIVLDTNRSNYDIKEAADSSMTVAELIEELRYLPEDCKVVFRNDGSVTATSTLSTGSRRRRKRR